MQPEHIARLSRLVDAAAAFEPAQREAWIAGLQGEDAALAPALRRALERMGADTPGDEWQPRLHQADFEPPPQVGPYRLLRPLGRGGMGQVWLAERADGAYTRQVALKLPHALWMSEGVRRRFARERDLLAALSHPHIARFLDAGVAGERPWLAMEWVEGRPITSYADEAGLDVPQRLRLMLQVLEALEHAHQRLIAHRDLKPSNILVTAEGEAKLLDFGIARLLDDEHGGQGTDLTRLGGRMLTPDYAAPEQLAGEPVTAAVDLFALGVVMFELLARRHPFTGGGAARDPTTEAPLASSRVPADLRDATALRKALRGDLDAVLARALEIDPARRYRSAAEFGADVRHVLRGEPVMARRIGWAARGVKFVRRHRVESALAAALGVTLVAGVSAIAWAGAQARAQADRAEREAERARVESRHAETEAAREKATKEFLIGVFKASDPRFASDQPRGAITARRLLDVASHRIDSRFAADPDTRIELLGIVADIYEELDENQRFGELLKIQTELARAHYGPLHPVTLNCLLRGADDAFGRGELDEAQADLDRLDPMLREAHRDEAAERGYWWFLRGMVWQSRPDDRQRAEDAFARAAALYAAHAPDDPRHAYVLSAQGNLVHARGDELAAAAFTRHSIEILERVPERDEGGLSVNYSNLGKVLAYAGDFAAAEAAHARAVKLAESTYGRDAWPYWVAANARAEAVHLGGDRERAAPLFADLARVLPPPGHPFRNALEESAAARARQTLGQRLVAEGRPAEALPLFEMAQAGFAHAPQYEYDLRQNRLEIGIARSDMGQQAQALPVLREALAEYRAKAPPTDLGRQRAGEALARALLRSGQAEAAGRAWQQVLLEAGDRARYPVVMAHEGLAELALGRHDGALALASLQRADAVLARLSGVRDIRFGTRLDVTRAQALLAAGRTAEARDQAQQVLKLLRRYDAPAAAIVAEAESVAQRATLVAAR